MMNDIEWRVSPGLTDYADALSQMGARAEAIAAGTARELVWLLEHPPVFTAGTSADPAELFNPQNFPVFQAGRGGRYTYHGPGQRVGYVLLDLDRRSRDVRHYVHSLEDWILAALANLGVEGRSVGGRVGIWVDGPKGESKIGAIGVRVRRWVTTHGFSVNVDPELSHFSGIIPCGISQFPVTSLKELGVGADLCALDRELKGSFDSFVYSVTGQREA